MRKAVIKRDTLETRISLELDLDQGARENRIETGFGFADHMLTLLSHWADIHLKLECQGDIQVDAHHSLEDVGICLGQALLQALGDRRGINRIGLARVPMDEAMAEAVVDISGRPYLVYQGDHLLSGIIAGQEKDLWREFFKSLAFNARLNLHINFLYGSNSHHLLESAFKATGLGLRQAVFQGRAEILSTKGSLD
ncbi:imidazoleglycerol-phosphate dehydratase HisB [Desulfonatronovibrio hydrogenovorans]|uniref:imidazoleglycerol-phosphate dehydratase HisB n=1 Tax=Desulfonatronovibrio hydrogenovorans TaxID=53245 RepID=UPI000491ABA5|nr:imidazoleglycerol-phosphate dehydratase HisB [Desulfonatronovibrio hydrogenovorans]